MTIFFFQQLFNIYSRIQTHLQINNSEAETRAFVTKLKMLLNTLLRENPTTSHTLVIQMLQFNFFITHFESLINDSEESNDFCGLFLLGLFHCQTLQPQYSIVAKLSQTPYRYQLCLLLLADNNISFLKQLMDEDKLLFTNGSESRLRSLVQNGMQPLEIFSDMILMGRHFLFQILVSDIFKQFLWKRFLQS